MKIKNAVFHHSAHELAAAPAWDLPEIALIGRSNVGKSSLVNMLTNRKSLALTSSTPGKTRLLNFFIINDAWSLVDLPGYGYAKVSRPTRSLFDQAVGDYLTERGQLAHCFVLIDSRIPPQKIDLEFLQWVSAGTLPYSLLFTKAEKLSAGKSQATVDAYLKTLDEAGIRSPTVALPCSSVKGLGRVEILNAMGEIIAKAQTTGGF